MVFLIPIDYSESTHPNIVPICVAAVDHRGNPVHRGWIDHGVLPVVEGLHKISHRLLGDRHRTSEITEYAVHSLSRKHGSEFGDHPEVLVLNRARNHALDLRDGGRRNRRKLDVELFPETLEGLEERYHFAAHFEAKQALNRMVEELDELGLERVKELIPFMLLNADGRELSAHFNQKRNTLTKRFYRGMRKAAEAAGISWPENGFSGSYR
jgi:hypothetical protein